jgi:FKBP-type peptidyl-prolyl cis-trans isomerase FkpA
MRKLIVAALAVLIAVPALAAEAPKTDNQKTLYSLGVLMARQLAVFNLSSSELELVKQGLTDGTFGNKLQADVESYKTKIPTLAMERRTQEGEKLAAEAKAFTDKAAKEKGAEKTASGLIYIPTKQGAGASPSATDKVKVNYRGTLINGREFDSSYSAGKPAELPLDKVIKCWGEGVQKMKVGGKARLICPPALAYGEQGSGPTIPPNATLVFDIELLDIVK